MKQFRTILILIVAVYVILQGFTDIDLNNRSSSIIFTISIIVLWIFGLAMRRNAGSPAEENPSALATKQDPIRFEGQTYASVNEMQPDVRQRFHDLVGSLKSAEPEEIEARLRQLERDDLADGLHEALEMMKDGLLSNEDYVATRDQIITELEK